MTTVSVRTPRAAPRRFSKGQGAPRDARKIAQHLRLSCAGYDSLRNTWQHPERALWWQVVEESFVDTAHLGGPDPTRRRHAEEAVGWLRGPNCDGCLCALGLDADYVRRALRRWLAYSGLERHAP